MQEKFDYFGFRALKKCTGSTAQNKKYTLKRVHSNLKRSYKTGLMDLYLLDKHLPD
jgi:hypothetical protein